MDQPQDIFAQGYDSWIRQSDSGLSLPTLYSSAASGTGGEIFPTVSSLANPITEGVDLASVISGSEVGAIMAYGKRSFDDTTTAGWIQGMDTDGVYKWLIGGSSSSIDWSVTTADTLTIVGSITATTGTIGGFSIGATTLSATNLVLTSGAANTANITVGTGANSAGINSVSAASGIAFWSGSTFANRATANFRVRGDGATTVAELTATSLNGLYFGALATGFSVANFAGSWQLTYADDGATGLSLSGLYGTLSIGLSKTFTVSNTLTLAGTDSTVMTFPTTSATIARTDAANTFTGASTASAWVLTSPTITTNIKPTTNDGAALGTSDNQFSDLFLASGGVVSFASTDWVATHTAGILTVGTGDFRVTTAGTNTASVVTVGGSQTLTSKTLTSPTLTTPSAFTTGGTITLAENTSIALDPAGSADGKYSGITVTGTSGYSQAFGDLVYLAVADSRWEAADADAASTSGDVVLAMVVVTGTNGNACTLLLKGIIRADANFPALTVGAPVYVSTTAGDIQVAQPSGTDDVIRRVGFALTADEILFDPSNDYITHT